MEDTAIIKITGTSGVGKTPVAQAIRRYIERSGTTVSVFDQIPPSRYQEHEKHALSDRFTDSVAILVTPPEGGDLLAYRNFSSTTGGLTISFGNRWVYAMELVLSAFNSTEFKKHEESEETS